MKSVYEPHERVQLECPEISRTRQSEAESCDINRIMARYAKSGLLDHVNKHEGQYGDFASAPEYHEACNKVIAANEMFASLPSSVRNYFDNDPAAFLDCAGDPERIEEMRELGLVPAEAVTEEPPKKAKKPAEKPAAADTAETPIDTVKPADDQ